MTNHGYQTCTGRTKKPKRCRARSGARVQSANVGMPRAEGVRDRYERERERHRFYLAGCGPPRDHRL